MHNFFKLINGDSLIVLSTTLEISTANLFGGPYSKLRLAIASNSAFVIRIPSSGELLKGGAICALTPATTVVPPNETSAEPSALLI